MTFQVILAQIVVSLILTAIVSRLMKPKGIKAAGLDDFTFPTVEQDRAIPVVFGDVFLEGPNVTWFGDYQSNKIKEGGGLFAPDVVVGNNYRIGMELALCWGKINSLSEVWFGDNQAFGTAVGDDPVFGNLEYTEFIVDAKELFGGKKNGGGVAATCYLYAGTSEQEANPYMTEQVGKGYTHRGVAKVIWHGPRSEFKNSGDVGESNFVPPIKFRVQHYPTFLGSGKASIGNGNQIGANPAEVIFALLTGRYIGLDTTNGAVPVIPEFMIDTATFLSAANTLHSEGMGISFQWQRDATVMEIIEDIVYHIDGFMSEDTHTGLIRLVLNRQDYDPNTVLEFNESNVKDVVQYARISPSAAVNRMKASFTDPDEKFKSIPVMVEDLGNMYEQEGGSPGEMDLHMFHDVNTCIQRATWELVQLSEGIVSGTIITNRDSYAMNIGDPFKFSWPGYGVEGLLCRVVEKRVGALDNREIEIKFVQDIYGIGTAIYSPPVGGGWTDIYNDPEDITDYEIFEMPHWIWNLAFSDTTTYQIFLLTRYPTNDTLGYQPYLSFPAGDDEYYTYGMGSDYPETDYTTVAENYSISEGPAYDTITGLRVIGGLPEDMQSTVTHADMRDNFRNWIKVGDEIMTFTSSTVNGDGTTTLNNVYRGLIDTTPKTHPVGERVWFLGQGFIRILYGFQADEEVNIKTIVTSSKGVLDAANAAAKNYTMIQRRDLPYVPGNIQINSGYYPEIISGQLEITWNIRNREDVSDLHRWDDTGQVAEAGQTTTVNIYGQSNTLIRSATGLTGEAYTYPLETEVADAGAVQTILTVEIFSVSANGNSFSTWSHTFNRQIGEESTGLTINLDEPSGVSSADVNIDLDVPA